MGVSIVSPPPPAAFSLNRIVVNFQGDLFFTLPGIFSINEVHIAGALTEGTVIELRWGENLQRFTAKSLPIGGNDLPLGTSVEAFKTVFQANYYINRDFVLTTSGSNVVFTARAKSVLFNFTPYNFGVGEVINSTFGLEPTKLTNHGVALECQIKRGSTYETIYSERLTFVGNAYTEIDISSLLHAELKPDLPTVWNNFSPIKHSRSWLKYRLKYAEASAETAAPVFTSDYVAMLGGTGHQTGLELIPSEWVRRSTAAADHALRFGSKDRWLQVDEPQFLTFLNTRQPYSTLKLKARVEYADGSFQTTYYHTVNTVLMYERITFEVSFLGLNIPTVNTAKGVLSYYISVWGDDAQVSEEYRYIIDYANRESKRYFVYLNSLGAWDSFCAYGEGSGEVRFSGERIETYLPRNYDPSQGTLSDVNNTSQRNFTVSTGYQTATQISMLEDFQLSRYKFLYQAGKVIPIILTADPLPTGTDGQNLYSHTFQYQHAFKNRSYDA